MKWLREWRFKDWCNSAVRMIRKQNDGLLQEQEFNMHAREGWGRGKETAREEVMLVCLEVAESLVGRMITDRTNTRGQRRGRYRVTRHVRWTTAWVHEARARAPRDGPCCKHHACHAFCWKHQLMTVQVLVWCWLTKKVLLIDEIEHYCMTCRIQKLYLYLVKEHQVCNDTREY